MTQSIISRPTIHTMARFIKLLFCLFYTILFCSNIILAQAPEVKCILFAGDTECTLQANGRKVIDVFELAGPRRLVVDLSASGSKSHAKVNREKGVAIKAIRSAAHSDKYRIVFDIVEQADSVSWQDLEGAAVVKVRMRTADKEVLPVIEKPEQTPSERVINKKAVVPTPIPETNQVVATIIEVESQPQQPVINSVMDQTPPVTETEQLSDQQTCSHIEFINDNSGDRPMIVLTLSQYPAFSFSRVNARLYRLKINNAVLAGQQLQRPFFPPHNFPRVTYVEFQSKQVKDALIVDIGIERGATLKANARPNSIAIVVEE